MYYKLDEDKNTIPATLLEWSNMFEDQDGRRVDFTEIGDYEVSTVFLGLDHNHFGGRPLLFETMIFGKKDSPGDEYQTRCSTWEEAKEMHKQAIDWINRGCPDE